MQYGRKFDLYIWRVTERDEFPTFSIHLDNIHVSFGTKSDHGEGNCKNCQGNCKNSSELHFSRVSVSSRINNSPVQPIHGILQPAFQ